MIWKTSNYKIPKNIDKKLSLFQKLFKNDHTFKYRKIVNQTNPQINSYLLFLDGMVETTIINENIIRPFVRAEFKTDHILDEVAEQIIYINEIKRTQDVKELIEALASGDTLMLLDNEKEILILNTKGYDYRSIMEPENEKILTGPREGFTESLLINTALLRRKIKNNKLKFQFQKVGKVTNTNVCVCYIEGIVNEEVLKELYKRLAKIDIDAILDSNYILEIIDERKYTVFKRIGMSERPDAIIGKILEGRIAVLVDGTPVVLTLPYLFIENFQSPEDYYLSSDYSSFSRLIRILGFLITILTPAFYIGVVAFHREVLPLPLFINIAIEQQNTPMPAAIELFSMLIVFEIIKEAGLRMPAQIGDALSIVGALVIGQAAVEAKLVSAPLVIIIGITGISNLLVNKLESAILFYRFFSLILTSIMGFLGFIVSFSVLLINILNQKSFGVYQIQKFDSLKRQQHKDLLVRRNWIYMITRPLMLTKNIIRQNIKGDKK